MKLYDSTKIAELRKAIGQIPASKTPRKSFTPKQRQEVLRKFLGQCALCSRSLAGTWHIDHVIPIALTGKHEMSNWQALCVKCHSEKTKDDIGNIAKTNRLIKADFEPHKPSRIKSRGFDKSLRKRMDGTVERKA